MTKEFQAAGRHIVRRENLYGFRTWVVYPYRSNPMPRPVTRCKTLRLAFEACAERERERTVVRVTQSCPMNLAGLTLEEAVLAAGTPAYQTTGSRPVQWASAEYALGADGTMELWRSNWDSSD